MGAGPYIILAMELLSLAREYYQKGQAVPDPTPDEQAALTVLASKLTAADAEQEQIIARIKERLTTL